MKLFTYLFSITAIVALAGLFIFKQPNGKTWLSIKSFIPDTQVIGGKIDILTFKFHELFNSDENSTVEVYRWRDSKGNWNYSDKPQAFSDTESEKVSFDSKNITVLPAIEVPSINSPIPITKEDEVSSNSVIVTPSKVTKLYKDANNIQNIMDAREASISKSLKKSID